MDRHFFKEEDGFTMKPSAGTTYRIPLPDFVVWAGVHRVTLRGGGFSGAHITINGRPAASVRCTPHTTQRIAPCINQTEYTVESSDREAVIHLDQELSATPLPQTFTLLIEMTSRVTRPINWQSEDISATTPLPAFHPLFDYGVRDTSLCRGKDGEFFLTGSTGAPDMWAVTSDIQVWRSPDLKVWSPVVQQPRARSVVWSIDRDGTWERKITLRDSAPFRPLWAPEIHYIKGNYWIAYSIPRLGTGLLKSTTGKPEGPYRSALKVDAPLTPGIDASIFQDDDGAVYFLWAGGMIARMTENMDALEGPIHQLRPRNAEMVGFEGSSLFKYKGKYYLSAADYSAGDYNGFTASSDSLFGPYSDRYISVPHGGHTNVFEDDRGNLWSTFFGSDTHAPFTERPAILPMHIDDHGELKPDTSR